MSFHLRLITTVCLGMSFVGCSQRRTTPDPFVGQGAPRGAAASKEGTADFRQELLISQLRHTELDLQTAKTESERRHLQERANTIRNQLALLGETQTRTTHRVAQSSEPSGDPFRQPQHRDMNLHALTQQAQGRTHLSDMQAADTAYASGQPVTHGPQSPIPQTMRDPQAAEVDQAAAMIWQSQQTRKANETTADQRRLRELELELQFTEDHAKQDALAIEIAKLRRQIHRTSGK